MGALFLLGYFTIVSDEGPFAKEGSQIVIYFDNSEGLKKGSRVTLLGIPVGRVEDITLIPVNHSGAALSGSEKSYTGHKVAVTAGVRDKFIFYKNYTVQVRSSSLLENNIIFINPGTPVDEAGNPVGPLPVLFMNRKELSKLKKTAVNFQLEKKHKKEIHELNGEEIKDPLAAVADMFSENRNDIRRIISNTADITGKANNGNGSVGLIINDDRLHYDAHSLVNDAEIVLRDYRMESEEKRERAPVKGLFSITLTFLGL